jgi:hypothetical protein
MAALVPALALAMAPEPDFVRAINLLLFKKRNGRYNRQNPLPLLGQQLKIGNGTKQWCHGDLSVSLITMIFIASPFHLISHIHNGQREAFTKQKKLLAARPSRSGWAKPRNRFTYILLRQCSLCCFAKALNHQDHADDACAPICTGCCLSSRSRYRERFGYGSRNGQQACNGNAVGCAGR